MFYKHVTIEENRYLQQFILNDGDWNNNSDKEKKIKLRGLLTSSMKEDFFGGGSCEQVFCKSSSSFFSFLLSLLTSPWFDHLSVAGTKYMTNTTYMRKSFFWLKVSELTFSPWPAGFTAEIWWEAMVKQGCSTWALEKQRSRKPEREEGEETVILQWRTSSNWACLLTAHATVNHQWMEHLPWRCSYLSRPHYVSW